MCRRVFHLPTHLAFIFRAVAQMNHRSGMSFSRSAMRGKDMGRDEKDPSHFVFFERNVEAMSGESQFYSTHTRHLLPDQNRILVHTNMQPSGMAFTGTVWKKHVTVLCTDSAFSRENLTVYTVFKKGYSRNFQTISSNQCTALIQ